MDVVIRSSQGEAEVTIAPVDPDATLGEVIEDVTDRPAPRVVHVDGHPVPSDTSLGSSGMLVGSVLDAGGEPDPPPRDAVVELVQLAGHGAGRRLWLAPGHYRIGPGRRIHGVDLAEAAVAEARLELRVATDGSVGVRSAAPGARIDGAALGTTGDPDDGSGPPFRPWGGGRLVVGGRVFELERRDPGDERGLRRRPAVGVDGLVAFNRPPRVSPAGEPALRVPDDHHQRAPATPPIPLSVIVAPLAIAVAAAVVVGDARLLLIGLLTPLLAVARWLFDRGEVAGSSSVEAPAGSFRAAVATRRADDQALVRSAHPTVPQLATTALRASPTLWQRRPGDPDAFQIPVGLADRPWEPHLEGTASALADAESIVEEAGGLFAVPVVADLVAERGIGIVASEDSAAELARGVMLAAAGVHGPADLDIVVLTSADRLHAWEFAKWLPHARRGGGPAVLSDDEQVVPWAEAIRDNHSRPVRPTAPSHITLVVVDDPRWWRDRSAPLRPLFADATLPLRFVAMAPAVVDLPAVCTTVITEDDDEQVAVEYVLRRERIERVAANFIDASLALEVARALAPLDDPDVPTSDDSTLPVVVPILEVLELHEVSSSAILERWSTLERPAPPRAPIGTAEHGEVVIDLVADGPHGLIVGATGSGKSELLLTLIAGLAMGAPPDDLNLVLVDVAGGSRFDACAALPHTVGVITDVDEHLADRFLRCMRAEVRRREAIVRDAGVASLSEYHRRPGRQRLPRLVLVVDEFAAAAEFPGFLTALADVSQRGAALGIHMILATRQPAGVVDTTVMAITNLRIALRLQDEADSMDVVGTRDAASLPRRIPGRAYARLADSGLVEFQAACSTGVTDHLGGHRFGLRPFVLGRALTPLERRIQRQAAPVETVADERHPGRESDLARLVRATSEAARTLGQDQQRRPFPDALPRHVAFDDFLRRHAGDGVPFGLVDLPDEQRQEPAWWQPGPGGTLIAYGASGAGTTSLLVTLALGAASRQAPDDLHLYAIDAEDALAPLEQLPHCGAVVPLGDADRVSRLLRFLGEELDRRTSLAGTLDGPGAVARREPSIVLLLDDVGALHEMLDEQSALDGGWQTLERVVRDGCALGMCAVMTAKHDRAIPGSLATQIDDRLVLQLADRFGYATFGFRPVDLPEFVPGRAVRVTDKAEVQLIEPPSDVASAVGEIDEPAIERPPRRIHPLPASLSVDAVVDAARATDTGFAAAVGLSTATAGPIHLAVDFGEAVCVAGPPRSGKSSVLTAIARAARLVRGDATIFAVGPRGGPLMSSNLVDDRPDTPADVTAWVERIVSTPGPKLVIVDDADRVAGPSFEQLGRLRREDCAVVVAGVTDDLVRSDHWSRPLQPFRRGVLIGPRDRAAELLDVPLGPALPRFSSATGVVVDDGATDEVLLVSVADGTSPDGARPSAADAAQRSGH